jgi:hypothetical protein
VPNFLFFLFAFTLTSMIAAGQSITGLTGGYHKANYYDTEDTPHYSGEYQSHPGYCITAFLKPRKNKSVNVGVEFSFVNKRLDVQTTSGGLGGQTHRDVHYNLNYFYVSIFPEFKLADDFFVNLSIGPALGFLVNSSMNGSSYSYNQAGYHNSWNDKGSADDDFGGDLRLVAGINIEVPLHDKFKVAVNNSFSIGLTSAGLDVIRSNDFAITAGIICSLDKFTFSLLPKHRPENNKK